MYIKTSKMFEECTVAYVCNNSQETTEYVGQLITTVFQVESHSMSICNLFICLDFLFVSFPTDCHTSFKNVYTMATIPQGPCFSLQCTLHSNHTLTFLMYLVTNFHFHSSSNSHMRSQILKPLNFLRLLPIQSHIHSCLFAALITAERVSAHSLVETE